MMMIAIDTALGGGQASQPTSKPDATGSSTEFAKVKEKVGCQYFRTQVVYFSCSCEITNGVPLRYVCRIT